MSTMRQSTVSSSFRGVHSIRPRGFTPRPRRSLIAVAGLGNYVSEAFARIFSVADDEDVEWEKMTQPFSGRITHHEETQLRRLYDVVQTVKGCTDMSAMNYDPSANIDDGSCEYDPNAEPTELKNYLEGAVERVFGNQFKGDETEPNFPMVSFSGQIKSQREIEKMLTFEKAMRRTLDEAEVEEKE